MTDAVLYVHVPFCLTRCGYCDFNAYAGLDHLASRYVRALAAEADLVAPAWRGVRVVSVFLGGGTPTILPTDDLAGLLAHLRTRFDVAEDAEVTIEANPDTVDGSSLSALRAAGYRRLSMGVQSLDPAVLASLERVHGPAAARRAVGAARAAGYDDLNLDLIYGAEGETDDSWRGTLEGVLDLAPEHISAYALTVEPATPLGRAVAAGARPAPDADVQADRYRIACEALAARGYRHYEVSNWALPGHECRHNLGYWRREPCIALGAGAHGFRDGRRTWNVRPPQEYLDLVGSGQIPVGGEEVLGPDEERLEEVFLRLRTFDGVDPSVVDRSAAADLEEAGLLVRGERGLVATEQGMLLLNELVLALVPDLAVSTSDC